MKSKIYIKNIIFDIILIFISFLSISYLKNEPFHNVIEKYFTYFLFYTFIFVSISLLYNKYEKKKNLKISDVIKRYFNSWTFSSLIGLSLVYIIRIDFTSRFVIIGVLLLILILEFIWLSIYASIQLAVKYNIEIDLEHQNRINEAIESQKGLINPNEADSEEKKHEVNIIREVYGEEILKFISNHINVYSINTEYYNTSSTFSVLSKKNSSIAIVNFYRLNDIRRINKFIESIHTKIVMDGFFICCAETYHIRKQRLLSQKAFFWGYIKYFLDFIFRRVFPKIPYINKLYFIITKGQNRALSQAEILGRLYSCGFEYIECKRINSLIWFVVKRGEKPIIETKPTYGPLIKLERIGKNMEKIEVYKFRTMHPFSEFLQQYIYEHNYLDEKSKFKDDFRVTGIGRFMRKFWIDELPMIINLINGDIKLVGVRPLSIQFFNLYPKDMQKLRTQFKPGLIPPYYVDLPKNFNEVIESERKYLISYSKSPFITNFKYFFKALFNIFFRNARSK